MRLLPRIKVVDTKRRKNITTNPTKRRNYKTATWHKGKFLTERQISVSDPLFFFTDPDPTQSGSGSWPNLDKNSKFRNFLAFFGKKNFVDFLCLSKSALYTQILEHLEEI